MRTVEVTCDCCYQPFMARTADRRRGWARFCSKSCKAKVQVIRTNGANEGAWFGRDYFTFGGLSAGHSWEDNS